MMADLGARVHGLLHLSGRAEGKSRATKEKICRRSKSWQGVKKVRRSDSERCETKPQLPVAAPPRCDFCQRGENGNKYGCYEELLYCKECTAKAHPSCMDYTEELAQRARRRPWQCIDCKTCIVCKDPGEPDQMLFCDGCDRGYHMYCHSPRITQENFSGAENEKWICSSCEEEGVNVEQLEQEEQKMKAKKQSLPNPKPHTPAPEKKPFMEAPCVSPVAGDEASNHNGSAMNGRVEPEQSRRTVLSRVPVLEGDKYPDASNWSIEDVVSFFRSAGFEDQCDAFRQQEIDGRSLLLMKRSDVLTGLSIKLGPALKINRHVQGLQAAYQHSFH